MMRYAAFVVFVALSLQASARQIQPDGRYARRNEIDISDDIEVKAPSNGHADGGYPEIDVNPFKEPLVSLAAGLAELAHDYLKDENDFPVIIETIFKSVEKIDRKKFNEFLDVFGIAQTAIQEAAEKEQEEYNVIPDDSEVKAPSHGHADKGYPEFDGNPARQSLVEITTWLSRVARDAVKKEKDVPLIIKQFLKSAQKTNWDSFDEYLDFWETALKTMKSYYDRFSNDVDNDSNDE